MSRNSIDVTRIGVDYQPNSKSKQNTMDCEVWTVIDEVNLNLLTINWNETSLEASKVVTCKELLRYQCGKSTVTNGPLYGRTKSIKNIIAKYKSVVKVVSNLFGPNTRFDQLNLTDIKQIMMKIAENPNGGLWTSRTVENILYTLYHMRTGRENGSLTDGINIELPRVRHLMLSLRKFVESHQINFEEWMQSGSWGTLPLDAALYVLNKQFEVIESPLVSFLLEYFEFQRSGSKVQLNKIYKFGKFCDSFVDIATNVKTKNKVYKKNKTKKLYKLAEIFVRHGFLDDLNCVCKDFRPGMLLYGPNKIKRAALYIATAISGIRISEISSIRHSKFELVGEIRFITRMYKTDRGLPRKRSISKHAYRAIDIASRLSYIPIDNNNVSPFASTHWKIYFDGNEFSSSKSTSPKPESLAQQINNTYKQTIEMEPDITSSFPKSTHPHALRHVFAAIAVRAFKGDVREHVRRHFGHDLQASFTRAYIDGKLTDAIISATQADFFKNFVSDMSDDDQMFYAAVSKRIRERVYDNHVFTSPDEISELFISEAIKACDLVGHEFGYFLPEGITTDVFDIHQLSDNSKAEDIVRTGITHQHLIDSIDNDEVKEASLSVLEMCESMLYELDVEMDELTYE